MSPDQERLAIEVGRLDWARELPRAVIDEFVAAGDFAEFSPGKTVFGVEQAIDRAAFVISGRLVGTLYDQIGKEIHREVFGRGTVVGLFSMLLPDPSHLLVEAAETTTVLLLSLEELLRLCASHRQAQLAVLRLSANLVKKVLTADRDRPKPTVVAVVHHSPATRHLSIKLASRLRNLGESPCVVGDDDRWTSQTEIPYQPLFHADTFVGGENVNRILKEWAAHRRLFIDVGVNHSDSDLARILSYSDAILWCLEPDQATEAVGRLRDLTTAAPGCREKIRLVWQSPVGTAPPYVPELFQHSAGQFKTYTGSRGKGQGKLFEQGPERIIRFLRGVQVGIALGGGAARGMAHLGVLKALEDHGVFVDMIAGTSAGAMVGTVYAAGLDPETATQCFKGDLLPSWFFRQLPAGGYWYLLYKYRRGQFEPMLRKYMSHLRTEQLIVPVTTVAVDLVDAVPLLFDTGDATENILSSINLPPLALPIERKPQALVDGGLLNNVPADSLVARGCNFVIASTVSAKLEKDFMGLRRGQRRQGRLTASLQVILRQSMIQSHSMNAVGVQPADLVISPDVSSFDISEFTRADEMAVIGEQATRETVGQLKSMLAKLDPQLFRDAPSA